MFPTRPCGWRRGSHGLRRDVRTRRRCRQLRGFVRYPFEIGWHKRGTAAKRHNDTMTLRAKAAGFYQSLLYSANRTGSQGHDNRRGGHGFRPRRWHGGFLFSYLASHRHAFDGRNQGWRKRGSHDLIRRVETHGDLPPHRPNDPRFVPSVPAIDTTLKPHAQTNVPAHAVVEAARNRKPIPLDHSLLRVKEFSIKVLLVTKWGSDNFHNSLLIEL